MQVAAEAAVLVVEEAADVKVRKLSVVRFCSPCGIYLLFSKVESVQLKPDRWGIRYIRTVLELTLYEPYHTVTVINGLPGATTDNSGTR